MRISDWSADVCSSDLADRAPDRRGHRHHDQEGGRLVTRDILTIADLDSGGLNAILDLSTRADPGRPLAGKGVALVFQKPSARTRNSMEMATVQLGGHPVRSEEHTSELQSLMRISYAVFCLKKKKKHIYTQIYS